MIWILTMIISLLQKIAFLGTKLIINRCGILEMSMINNDEQGWRKFF